MSDDLSDRFDSRRPMLEHVASELCDEIRDLLEDEGVLAHTSFKVMRTSDFLNRAKQAPDRFAEPLVELTEQIRGNIAVRSVADVTRVESAIRGVITVHSDAWQRERDSPSPSLLLTCVVPPLAMPDGWRTRDDVPVAFELTITLVGPPSEPGADLLPLLPFTQSGEPVLALVMKGGGIKGLAYVGAVEVLCEHYRFNWFVGTSAGAITAIMLGAGFSPAEMLAILKQKDFRDFFDANWYAKPINMVFCGGMHRARTLTEWLDELLAKKLHSSRRVKLSDLPHRVTVYACRQGQAALKFDSLENDADAAYAARCSMSIPLYFTPETDQGINTYDGGLRQNFPVEQLLKISPSIPFVSLYLGAEVYEPVRRSVIWDVLSIWTEGGDAEAVSQYREQTVIIDPRPIRTLDFELADDEKEYLVACGRAAALSHVKASEEQCIAARARRDELGVNVDKLRKSRTRRRTLKAITCLFTVIVTVAICCMILWRA